MGLAACSDGSFYNTKLASRYLVKGKEYYQGNSILWRRRLCNPWGNLKATLKTGGRIFTSNPQAALKTGGSICASNPESPEQLTERIHEYIRAMDDVARIKTREILPLFSTFSGHILDVGAGSGAVSAGFLKRFPDTRATLLDLPPVLDYCSELLGSRNIKDRISFCPANILEPWPVDKGAFDLVVLSNVLHAFAQTEAIHLLDQARGCLRPDGLLLIHDFFREHCPEKASLFDLNMLLNTYNGKIFSANWVCGLLNGNRLHATEFIPLGSDTAVIIASQGGRTFGRPLPRSRFCFAFPNEGPGISQCLLHRREGHSRAGLGRPALPIRMQRMRKTHVSTQQPLP